MKIKNTKNTKHPADAKTKPMVTPRGISSVDELWGVKPKGYKFDNLEDYENTLRKMTSFDLESHAFNYDISPNVPRDIMIDQLIRLFKIDLMTKKGKLPEIPQITPELNKKLISIANS